MKKWVVTVVFISISFTPFMSKAKMPEWIINPPKLMVSDCIKIVDGDLSTARIILRAKIIAAWLEQQSVHVTSEMELTQDEISPGHVESKMKSEIKTSAAGTVDGKQFIRKQQQVVINGHQQLCALYG